MTPNPPEQAVEFLRKRLQFLNGHEAASLRVREGLRKCREALETLLVSTCACNGNASLLVIGEAGVGKTLMVEQALSSVLQQFNPDPTAPTVGVVKVDGYLHGQDRVAFQEIARQLCNAYNLKFSKAASHSENMAFLREVLRSLKVLKKTSVFIVDNIDQFTSQTTKQQGVLYNLLEMLQSNSNSAVVVGVSRSQDMHETMEKRAYSRFSNRRLVVLNLDTVNGPRELLEEVLLLPVENADGIPADFVEAYNQTAKAAVHPGGQIAQVLEAKTKQYGLTPADVVAIAAAAVTEWCVSDDFMTTTLTSQHVASAVELCLKAEESQANLISDLSVQELYCLVAMYRTEANGRSPCCFELVWEEFQSMRNNPRFPVHDKWAKHTIMYSFQRVVEAGLAHYLNNKHGMGDRLLQYEPVTLRVTRHDIQLALFSHPNAPPSLKDWLTQNQEVPV